MWRWERLNAGGTLEGRRHGAGGETFSLRGLRNLSARLSAVWALRDRPTWPTVPKRGLADRAKGIGDRGSTLATIAAMHSTRSTQTGTRGSCPTIASQPTNTTVPFSSPLSSLALHSVAFHRPQFRQITTYRQTLVPETFRGYLERRRFSNIHGYVPLLRTLQRENSMVRLTDRVIGYLMSLAEY